MRPLMLILLALAMGCNGPSGPQASEPQKPKTQDKWMNASVAATGTLKVGQKMVLKSPSPKSAFGVVFEDDGATGYFYGLDHSKKDNPIVDAMHIYDVQQVKDKEKPSNVEIVWSADGQKAALLINRYPHAVFDFVAKRGYCRTNFPKATGKWSQHSHEWDDAALELFK
jgi:hypothetical protein